MGAVLVQDRSTFPAALAVVLAGDHPDGFGAAVDDRAEVQRVAVGVDAHVLNADLHPRTLAVVDRDTGLGVREGTRAVLARRVEAEADGRDVRRQFDRDPLHAARRQVAVVAHLAVPTDEVVEVDDLLLTVGVGHVGEDVVVELLGLLAEDAAALVLPRTRDEELAVARLGQVDGAALAQVHDTGWLGLVEIHLELLVLIGPAGCSPSN